jgi:hypothetical protein
MNTKKYEIQIKIIDTDTQNGPTLFVPLDIIQESKIDVLKELIEGTIKGMEGKLVIPFHDEVCEFTKV